MSLATKFMELSMPKVPHITHCRVLYGSCERAINTEALKRLRKMGKERLLMGSRS